MTDSNTVKVCFVAPNIYGLYNPLSRSHYSGADAQLYELARFLSANPRFQVSAVTGDYGQEEIEYYNGVLVYRSVFDTSATFWDRALRRNTRFEDQLHEIDAHIYMMSGTSGLTQTVAEFCNKKKRSFIYRVQHQRDCDGTFGHGMGEEGRRYQWALHQAAHVICQTQEQRVMLRRTERLDALVLPNLLPLPAPLLEDAPRDIVIWAGEAWEWKQPEYFLRLALTITGQSFTMIAMPRHADYFERLVGKTRDVPSVGFENSVPYSEMPGFFSRAKLLINTSRYEGFPFSFTQALAYGVPVASLNVDPDGILEKHQIGVCAHGSEIRLNQDVSDLVTYERQRKRFSENAYNYAKANHNILTRGQEYINLFLKLTMPMRERRSFFSRM